MLRRSRESPTLSWRSTDSITTQVLLFDIFGSHLNLLAEHATCIEIICTLYAEIQKGIDTMKTLVGPLYNVPSSHHFNEMEKRSHTSLSTLSIYPSYQTGLNRSKICKGHTTPSTDSITMKVIHVLFYLTLLVEHVHDLYHATRKCGFGSHRNKTSILLHIPRFSRHKCRIFIFYNKTLCGF